MLYDIFTNYRIDSLFQFKLCIKNLISLVNLDIIHTHSNHMYSPLQPLFTPFPGLSQNSTKQRAFHKLHNFYAYVCHNLNVD